jgi:hypothetical protein
LRYSLLTPPMDSVFCGKTVHSLLPDACFRGLSQSKAATGRVRVTCRLRDHSSIFFKEMPVGTGLE